MALSLVGVTTLVASSGGVLRSTILFSSGQHGPDVVYLFGGCFNSATNLGPTIGPTSNSVGYATLFKSTTSVGGAAFGVWRKVLGATDRALMSSAFTTCAAGYGAMIIRGASSTSPEDVTTVFASGSSVNPQSPSVTPATNGAWLLSLVGIVTESSGMTAPTGFGNSAIATTSGAATLFTVGAAQIAATTGSTAPGVWTSTVTGTWIAASVVVQPYTAPNSSATSTLFVSQGPMEYNVQNAPILAQ